MRIVWLQATATVFLLAACSTSDPGRADYSAATATASDLATSSIEPVRPDERVLFARTGVGSDSDARFRLTSDGTYNIYGLCAEQGPLKVVDATSRSARIVVRCDGVTSRMQVFTEPRAEVDLRVEAKAGSAWTVLVTDAPD